MSGTEAAVRLCYRCLGELKTYQEQYFIQPTVRFSTEEVKLPEMRPYQGELVFAPSISLPEKSKHAL